MNRKHALIIFALALLVRLVYLTVSYDGPESLAHPDSGMYLYYVAMLHNPMIGGGESLSQGMIPLFAERAPGYVYFLAGFEALFGKNLLAVVVAQAIIDAVVCVLIGIFAGCFHPRLAVLSGFVAAFSPNMIVHSVVILTDSLFLLPFVGGLIATAAYFRAPSSQRATIAGGLFALTLIIRPVLYYFLPFLVVAFVIAAWCHRLAVLRAMRHVAAVVVCFALVLTPFFARNYQDYGYVDYVSQTGTHALYWIYPLAREYANGVPYEVSEAEMRTRLKAYRASLDEPSDPSNPFAQSAEMKHVAKEALLELGPYALAKAWVSGTIINLMTPAIISSPLVRNMERPSFNETQGANPAEKIWNYLSSNMTFTAVILPAVALTGVFRVIEALSLLQLFLRKADAGVRLPERTLDPALTLFMLMVGAYLFAVTGPVVGAKYRLGVEPALDVFFAAALIWAADFWRLRRQRRT